MNIKLTLTLDDQTYAVASGVFPDGAVWLKVTDALPTFARLMLHPCHGYARYERFYAAGATG